MAVAAVPPGGGPGRRTPVPDRRSRPMPDLTEPGVEPGRSDPEAAMIRARLHRRILLDFGRISLEELGVQPLLQRAAAQLARATGVRHAKVLRYRAEEGDLLIEAGVGWRPGIVGRARLGADIGTPAGRAVLTGEPVVLTDVAADPEYRLDPVLAEHGIVSIANVPLAFDGRLWGVLEVDSDRPREFDEAEMEFLELLACLLAGALQRADARTRSEAAASADGLRAGRETVLLRELQHRVKNNFVMVVSILARERRAAALAAEPRAAARFGRAMERVAAITLAHARLSLMPGPEGRPNDAAQAASGIHLDLTAHLRALCANLQVSLGERIAIELDLDGPCPLPFDRVVAAGLIVNELVSNAAKHAYPGETETGVVRIGLRLDEVAAEATLAVSDEGPGMDDPPPPGLPATGPPLRNDAPNGSQGGGQGLALVAALARQLGGRVERGPGPGGSSLGGAGLGGTVRRGSAVIIRLPLVA